MKMANKIVFLLLNCLAIVFLSEATVIKNSQLNSEVVPQQDYNGGVQVHGTRTKRYSALGRVPLAYINANKGHSNRDMEAFEMSQREQRISPASHFREFHLKPELSQPRGREDADSIVESEGTWEDGLERPVSNGPESYLPYAMARRNQRRYPGANNYDMDEGSLSDQDLESLLLLLDGYALNTDPKEGQRNHDWSNKHGRSSDESSSNYYSPQSLPMQTRNKRIGARTLFAMNSVNRIKKETDPEVSAQLMKVFGNIEHEHLHDNLKKSPEKPHDSSASTPPLLSGGHHKEGHVIAGPSLMTESDIKAPAAKKDIDWSNYFGIDKKDGHVHGEEKKVKAIKSEAETSSPSENKKNEENDKPQKSSTQDNVATPRVYKDTKDETTKESKKVRQREENETEDKNDRKWILKEFYKNLAMATNVKRKRESSPQQQDDNLSQLEQQMEAAGDKLIWDALKYTGAHKDQEMTENELSQVKQHIIEKLSAAYSLEKLREQMEEFRQELNGNENTNDNYDTLN